MENNSTATLFMSFWKCSLKLSRTAKLKAIVSRRLLRTRFMFQLGQIRLSFKLQTVCRRKSEQIASLVY